MKALARAFRWRKMLEMGRYGTIDEIASTEKINDPYVSRLLRLTLLAPNIVEAILDGRQADGMTLLGLMEPFPVEWPRLRLTSLQTPPNRERRSRHAKNADALQTKIKSALVSTATPAISTAQSAAPSPSRSPKTVL